MKKIIYFINCPFLIPRWKHEIKTLLENNYQVKVLAWNKLGTVYPNDNFNGIRFMRIDSGLKKTNNYNLSDGICKPTLWTFKANYSLKSFFDIIIFMIKAFFKLLKEDYDVIHCCYPVFLPVALIASKIKKSKVVYDVSELFIDHITTKISLYKSFIKNILSKSEIYLSKKVNGIMCVISSNNELFNRYFKVQKNTVTISNFSETKSHIDPILYNNLKIKYNNKQVIVYAGPLVLDKKILNVINCIDLLKSKYPNILFLMIGSCLGDDSKIIKEYINQKNLENNTEILNYLPYDILHMYYKCSQIGLVLIDKQFASKLTLGNSRKLTDYMKASLPVIAPNYGEIGYNIKKEKFGIVLPEIEDYLLSNAISYLLDNPSEAFRMGKQGYLLFLEKYNWDIEKIKFLNFYRSI